MTKLTLTIATRESPLALWQANWVKAELLKIHPFLTIELLGITTQADQMLAMPLYKVGGKGLFVKELEEALLSGRADIAVHSMKDVPMILPETLCVPVMCEREDPRDAFVSNHFSSLGELPLNGIIGTSSLRRQSQLLAARPDLQITFLRGNVNTRLSKLDREEFGAIILAAAGLKRLSLSKRISSFLSQEIMLPAAGQGVLGIECRVNDNETRALIMPLNDRVTNACVTAERSMCRLLGGGCQVPIAAYAESQDHQLMLRGLVASVDGTQLLRASSQCSMAQPELLGEVVANELLAQGAKVLLDEIKS
jgi:hydroxymethylbilane synthase